MRVSAIIAAGGRGVRFGGERPKQLAMLGGQSILQRSVDAFLGHELVSDVVVALPPEVVADVPAYLRGTKKPVVVVEVKANRVMVRPASADESQSAAGAADDVLSRPIEEFGFDSLEDPLA